MDINEIKTLTLPVLPLRGMVVFPKSVIHFDVGRKKSITAIKKAMETNQLIFLSAQIDASNNEPKLIDLYKTGVVAKVIQIQKLPENTTDGCRADAAFRENNADYRCGRGNDPFC